jgi:hypothetical protein
MPGLRLASLSDIMSPDSTVEGADTGNRSHFLMKKNRCSSFLLSKQWGIATMVRSISGNKQIVLLCCHESRKPRGIKIYYKFENI